MTPFLAVVAILGVSASGPLMAGTAAPAFAIAFWRNAAASVLTAPVALTRSRAELKVLGRHHWMVTVLAGFALAGHFATWVSALKLTSVAAATALVCSQIVWVVLYDRLCGVRLRPLVVIGLVVAVVGVLVVTGVDFTFSRRALAGDALAVAGGFFAAIYLLTGRSVRVRLSTSPYTFVCYGICAAVLLVLCVVTDVQLTGFSTRTWLLIAAVTRVGPDARALAAQPPAGRHEPHRHLAPAAPRSTRRSPARRRLPRAVPGPRASMPGWC